MDKHRKKLICHAVKKYKKIFPCAEKKGFEECFTSRGDSLVFWFNTPDHSTHVVKAETAKVEKL
ncbi:MAG: hypothetical protein GF401_04015 [Chitinivibrionales bacterium]|nr:hypothetical protein [Chitinivibrionales bacterium]